MTCKPAASPHHGKLALLRAGMKMILLAASCLPTMMVKAAGLKGRMGMTGMYCAYLLNVTDLMTPWVAKLVTSFGLNGSPLNSLHLINARLELGQPYTSRSLRLRPERILGRLAETL